MLTRRRMIAGMAAAVALDAAPRIVFGALPTDRRLVLLILRGAMDGLAAIPPCGDPDYRLVRGALALPGPGEEGGIIDLDGFFGLHPVLAPLERFYRAGEMTVVHAVATPYRERSHFDGQDLLENGTGDPHGRTDG